MSIEEQPEQRRSAALKAPITTPSSSHSTDYNDNDDDDPHHPTFVDYVAIPEVRVQPPAKYKLWLLVWILVYIASWLSNEANLYQALRFRGWLSPNASLFVMLSLIVLVMVYGALDLLVELGTFTYKTRQYGLGPWLKAGRAKWMYKFSERNVLIQVLATIVWKLEDGFVMFNVLPHKLSPARTHIRGKRRSKHPGNRLSDATSSSLSAAATVTPLPDNHHEHKSQPESLSHHAIEYDYEEDEAETDIYHCESEQCKVMLKIEHYVDPSRLEEYERWKHKIEVAVRQRRGFVDIICGNQTITNDDVEQQQTSSDDDEDLESGAPASALHDSESNTMSSHTVYCTFSNIGYLNEWLLSPRRKVLMKELGPLLLKPDVVQIQKDRVLPDAFTDLVIAQGQFAPSIPPKKWKVWWLTTLALFITIRWTRSFMPYYYEFWGLIEPHWQSLVGTAVSTLLNSYVMVPLMLFLFNPWMQRDSGEKDDREPWRTLEEGLKFTWMKALLTFALFGGCGIAWIARSLTAR